MVKDKRLIEFGNQIRAIRTEKGISQEKLAQLANLDRSYMGNVERGENNITLSKAYQICDALNIKLSDLV